MRLQIILSKTSSRSAIPATRSVQRGASLFVAIVALVLMTIAGLTLMRSVDTGNVIAGNMAFRESTVAGTDGGVEAAAAYVNTLATPATFAADANQPAGCTVGAAGSEGPPVVAPTLGDCRYSARIRPEDDDGVPFVDWSSSNIPVVTLNGNEVQFVVERLCNPDPGISVILTQKAGHKDTSPFCGSEIVDPGGSNKIGGASIQKTVGVMYRATVRVKGPRNTLSIVQAILER